MKRYIRLCLLTVITLGIFTFSSVSSHAQNVLQGILPADSVRVLLKGSTYTVYLEYLVEGTLIIEPGAEVQFNDNSRIVVAAGGRLIADGFASLGRKLPRPTGLATNAQVTNYWTEHGFADMRCFLFPIAETGTWATSQKTAGLNATEMGRRERTIHPGKYNHIFNVAIDTANRRLVNIADPFDGTWPVNDGSTPNGTYNVQNNNANLNNRNLIIVPFETAIMFMAARMPEYTATDVTLKLNDWERSNGSSVDVVPATIRFRGQPQLPHSREWGHIIVLPGARAAFFRNCSFEHFKKDTTVDNKPYYTNLNLKHDLSVVDLRRLNNEMMKLSNGGGGAITTFSSRTWVLDCSFSKNFARNRGGAMQILQAPTSFFYPGQNIVSADTAGIARFDFSRGAAKNRAVSDADSDISTVMNRNANACARYPMIDRMDETIAEYFTKDIDRMAWDDARLAGYLGRFRNLTFDSNMVRLAVTVGNMQDSLGNNRTDDNLNLVAPYPLTWGNMAFGGALYISGTEDDCRQIEFTLGMNDSIRLGMTQLLQNPNMVGGGDNRYKDYIRFRGNSAHNFQANKHSDGAKGGAIYVGDNTSVIVAGEFIANYTNAK